METIRKGGSVTRPPVLDGTNYGYWKAWMRAFIKSIDEKAWRAILTCWSPPTKTDREGNELLKNEIEWKSIEDKLANFNSKALNAIFTAVVPCQFKLISTCESTKEAWDILETAHEGTSTVRLSKLELLVGRFEKLRMKEEESITEFNGKVCDIANESFLLGEKIPDQKLVRKILKSLPKRFEMKAAAIAEARDLTTMKLEELKGSL